MQTENISLLLMDDEPTSPIIQATVEILRMEGFHLDVAETITRAVDLYYQKFYDVFILDIDMNDPDGNGINILKRFVSLHNQTRVIMFSGAGTKFDWFEAANAHCFAYVAKDENDATDLLIAHIRSAAESRKRFRSALRKEICPRKILMYCREKALRETAEAAIAGTFPEPWETTVCDSLEEIPDNPSDYGVIILLQDIFSTDFHVQERMKKILSVSPKPHVIVGCRGEDEYRPSILHIANLHPFRMISLSVPDWMSRLESAVKSAVSWYGREEILRADMDALRRVRVTLPEDALRHWEDFLSPEPGDEYDDIENYPLQTEVQS